MNKTFLLLVISCFLISCGSDSTKPSEDKEIVVEEPLTDDVNPSIARQWNDLLLESIRTDYARPTVHSRNLFHVSAVMYDAWAAYDDVAKPFLLGSTVGDFNCSHSSLIEVKDVIADRNEALSFASYRLLTHRFAQSPAAEKILADYNQLMQDLNYDTTNTSTDYSDNSAAALGNHIAQCMIDFGLQDGSNEANLYANVSYRSVNKALSPVLGGNPNITDFNRWQPLSFDNFIDQSGNVIGSNTPEFLGAEWGQVISFALSKIDKQVYQRDNFDYVVYHDPSAPPQLDIINGGESSDEYKWGFALVALWSSHLDPSDGVMWDISPGSIGNTNIQSYPQNHAQLRGFYNVIEGGDPGMGHALNPITNEPYEPQIVPRGDYTRVLAEFWADGPDSETPPGHWFTILNKVNDDGNLVKRFAGEGDILGALEWDVKSYFMLGGAMHDSAVTAWGIKGWYDYIRPVSSIRGMGDLGQSSDKSLASYHIGGLPLVKGFIEIVEVGEPLAGSINQHAGKIKIRGWRGPDYVRDPSVDTAGVDWILSENWWSYQRPSFITPPFAGYISGHSTFSRAAAEVLTLLTGDAFFPGGMGEFTIEANEFLFFENGPSVDLTLQWATYRDASDQTSLSRIWGGIHPPADDIPGRIIGEKIGIKAFERAQEYFLGQIN
ncbi:MAG: hypothetical protein ACI9U5_000043 [Colwellia sp.]